MADLVAAGLARPDDITLDLARRGDRIEPDILREVSDRLLAAPALRMHARVHDDPGRPVHEALKHADPASGEVAVHADLVGQLFRIEAPAFAISGYADVAVEKGNRLVFEDERPLPEMAGNALVIGKRRKRPFRPDPGVDQIDVISSRT